MATVIRVRRIVLMVALLASLASPRAASGHSCAGPVQIEPGRPAKVNIGVGAEDAAVVEVEVSVPSGFELDRVDDAQGWTNTREGQVIRFSGWTIPSFGCAYFTLSGTAPKRATLAFPLKVRTEAGGVQEYASRTPGAPDAAQLVYAGTEPGDPDAEGSSGTNIAQVVVIAGAVAAAVAAAGCALRYVRSGPTPRPPPRVRPSAGRGRGRPGSGSSRRGSRKRQRPRRR